MVVPLFFFRSETAQRIRAEGYIEGFAEGYVEGLFEGYLGGLRGALVSVLGRRSLTLSAVTLERIRSCSDAARLLGWLDQAETVETADALFEDED